MAGSWLAWSHGLQLYGDCVEENDGQIELGQMGESGHLATHWLTH